MLAQYVLAALAVAFAIASITRGPRSPQGRIWLRVAIIFAAVSVWLFGRG